MSLKQEIGQQLPFASLEEEALLNLMRTADQLDRVMQLKIRPYGITGTQYNVLRILRGAQPNGLTCSSIGSRMLTAEPDITRILSRLKTLRFIQQQRCKKDRRVVWTNITQAGLELLEQMDPLMRSMPNGLLGHLDKDQLRALIHLLEGARRAEPADGAEN